MSLRRNRPTPEFPSLDDIEAVRAHCRTLAEADGGGLVSADIVHLGGRAAVQVISKREELPAYGYTGTLIIPAGDAQFVLTLSTVERGTTGLRDAVVSAQLLERGELQLEEWDEPDSSGAVGGFKGWFMDPYDPDYPGVVLRSRGDDEEYDPLFPEHPLSKLRRWLPDLAASIKLTGTVAEDGSVKIPEASG